MIYLGKRMENATRLSCWLFSKHKGVEEKYELQL